jgi:hypothetical protein
VQHLCDSVVQALPQTKVRHVVRPSHQLVQLKVTVGIPC